MAIKPAPPLEDDVAEDAPDDVADDVDAALDAAVVVAVFDAVPEVAKVDPNDAVVALVPLSLPLFSGMPPASAFCALMTAAPTTSDFNSWRIDCAPLNPKQT